jgi:choline-sulfatase
VHDIGYWDNAIAYDGRIAGWGHRLQAAGIRVESIGKLHYTNATDPTGFDAQIEPMHIHEGIGQVWGSVRDPLPLDRPAPPMMKPGAPGESSYNRYDERIAAAACRWIERAAQKPDEPWCLFVGFVAPHFPLVVPARFYDLYPLDALPAPKLHPRDGYTRHPWVGAFDRYTRVEWEFSDHDRRTSVAAYLGLCTFLDEQVGKVLAALRTSGQEDRTLVVYSSDHGDNVGARGLWGKSNLYEESAAVPLIVAGPHIARGRTIATPVSLVDLHPTILEALVLPTLPELPGRSLLGAMDADRIVLSEYHAIGATSGAFMLRQERWKYHHYVGFAPELFDLEADPEEARDLASAHPQVVADFERKLRALLDPEAVDRKAKRAQAALVARFGGRDAALRTGTPGATPAPK